MVRAFAQRPAALRQHPGNPMAANGLIEDAPTRPPANPARIVMPPTDPSAGLDLADAHTAQPSLAGRRAIVTGGTTGIGRPIAVLLAAEGAQLFVCGRDPAHLDDALTRIRQVGTGEAIALDLARAGEVDRFFNAADAALGGLDIAIINAAIPADALEE